MVFKIIIMYHSTLQDSRTMGGGSHSAGGGRRPVKVWNSGRTIRKALVVSTYEEFQRKGREKLGLSSEEPISIVLEGDGTQVRPLDYRLSRSGSRTIKDF